MRPRRGSPDLIQALTILILAGLAISCRGPARADPLIDAFRTALCVPPLQMETREWDHPFQAKNGETVRVYGHPPKESKSYVRYAGTDSEYTAASGDSGIYPSDIRVNVSGSHIYIKLRGSALGFQMATYLVDYDL